MKCLKRLNQVSFKIFIKYMLIISRKSISLGKKWAAGSFSLLLYQFQKNHLFFQFETSWYSLY